MLTRQQWLWLADHHKEVRSWSSLALVFAVVIYVGLITKVTIEKGKAPISYRPAISHWEKLGCGPAVIIQPGQFREPQGFYEDASIYRLERHYTFMMDIEVLTTKPECFSAGLADDVDNPNPFVYLLYDKQKGRVIYRIARLDDVLKR